MRKIAAHYIFDGFKLIKNSVLIVSDDGKICSIEPFLPQKELAGVEFINGVLCPGFINVHAHLELSFLKGKLKPSGGLEHFIQQMKQVNRSVDSQKIEAAKLADSEMFDEGIVACGDIVNTDLTLPIKEKSAIFYHNFIELYSLIDSKADEVFQHGLQLYKLWEKYSKSITYHAPYSVSYALFQKISEFNNVSNDLCSIHFYESKREEQLLQQWQSGNWQWSHHPTWTIIEQIPYENRVLFVHNTFIDEKSFNFICNRFKQRAWVLCPSSNLFIENTMPPLHLLIKDKENICIGTDSYASNRRLSILNELKLLSSNFPEIELIDWLKMATIQGAKALNIQDKFGSFKNGTNPGVLALMEMDLLNLKLTDETYIKRIL
ncbi:MAG: amidohydrolase family protein [Bacteroidales bacterium]|nr:amidohydrolase family protein [Bacteroidales bacterium]